MPRVTFADLVELYSHIDFDAVGDEGTLDIATPALLAIVLAIENDDDAGRDANLSVKVDPSTLVPGTKVRVRVSDPRISLGLLARTLDDLLEAPGARVAEPSAYYVIDGRITRASDTPPPAVSTYRAALKLVATLSLAASYLDKTKQELVFHNDGRVTVPIWYDIASISKVTEASFNRFQRIFLDDVHIDQKLSILGTTISQLVRTKSEARRFLFILENLDDISGEVENGYKLFASSFSYSKIRDELEDTKAEYVSRIHKTFSDLQGQILGVPIAAFVVASQYKDAKTCGPETWTNTGILAGATVFLLFLAFAIINQWLTLASIRYEVNRQKKKLKAEYASVADQFVDVFDSLNARIRWHFIVFVGIGVVAMFGAATAVISYQHVTHVSVASCLAPLPSHAQTDKTAASAPSATSPGGVKTPPQTRVNPGIAQRRPQHALSGATEKMPAASAQPTARHKP